MGAKGQPKLSVGGKGDHRGRTPAADYRVAEDDGVGVGERL